MKNFLTLMKNKKKTKLLKNPELYNKNSKA